MKVKDIIKLVEKDGWFIVRVKGSHRQFHHPQKKGLVTIPGHLNDDVAKGTLSSIIKQADLNK
ncbi:MAG: type II toxin-antitoxin system HicA family toxin [Ignavibacteria bacterium]|nr:type II toxin-antitoxin system HicA family toxin [Ignavibacteria bacterium]